MTIPLATTVILNWNASHETLECLDSISKQDWKNHDIIIVDNGSSAQELEILTKSIGQHKLIANPDDLGSAGGMNVGIKAAIENGSDYVWIVNNDAKAPENTLSTLIEEMEKDDKIGSCSPIIYDADGSKINYAGGVWREDTLSFEWTSNIDEYKTWAKEQPKRIWLFGTALLISRKLIDAIGVLDEKFFMYGEDNDFSARAIKAGFRNTVALDAKILHNTWRSQKSPDYYYYNARNELLIIHDYGNTTLLGEARLIYWFLRNWYMELNSKHISTKHKKAIYAGTIHGFLKKTGFCSKPAPLAAFLGKGLYFLFGLTVYFTGQRKNKM